MATLLDEDKHTRGKKARSIGGCPMLIKPDGTYELYDWDAAKQYTWMECEEEEEATNNRSKELFWRKFRPSTGYVRSLERLKQFLNKNYVLIRTPTNMIDFLFTAIVGHGTRLYRTRSSTDQSGNRRHTRVYAQRLGGNAMPVDFRTLLEHPLGHTT